jgi:hypothetical protein
MGPSQVRVGPGWCEVQESTIIFIISHSTAGSSLRPSPGHTADRPAMVQHHAKLRPLGESTLASPPTAAASSQHLETASLPAAGTSVSCYWPGPYPSRRPRRSCESDHRAVASESRDEYRLRLRAASLKQWRRQSQAPWAARACSESRSGRRGSCSSRRPNRCCRGAR